MRITIRLNKEEAAKLKLLMTKTNISDNSTALKFGVDWTLNHIDTVTEALISPNWSVSYSRKKKANPQKRALYF